MPGGKANYTINATLNMWLGSETPTVPGTVYCALFTVTPSAAGGGTEVSGGGYARVAITNNTTNFPHTTTGTKTNASDINFGTFTAGVGTVVAAALFDASSAGNLLYWGPLTTPQTIANGNTFKIPAGQAQFTEA